MARTPVVFFSHSSDDNARALPLCRAIEQAGQVRTTIDLRDLREGQRWREQLYRWIARCDAGFLLLTQAVMTRPGWVLEEATLLRAREIYHGNRFPLFVVLDDGVRETANWKALFEPLALTELQRSVLTDAQLAQTVAQACLRVAAQKSDDYFSHLRDLVGDVLAPFEQYRALTRAMHDNLDIADEYWQTIVGDEAVLACTLAQRLCEARETPAIGSYGGLDDLLSAFDRKGLAEERRNLLLALRPYWVNLGAAMKLAVVTQRPAGARLCALPTSRPDISPDLHIDRFFAPFNKNPRVLRVAAGNESVAGMTAQLIEAWNERHPQWPVATAAQLNGKLQALSVHVIVILPPLAVARLARDLAAAFPIATFIVPVPHLVNLHDADWRGITVLEPARRGDEEETFATQYEVATGFT